MEKVLRYFYTNCSVYTYRKKDIFYHYFLDLTLRLYFGVMLLSSFQLYVSFLMLKSHYDEINDGAYACLWTRRLG